MWWTPATYHIARYAVRTPGAAIRTLITNDLYLSMDGVRLHRTGVAFCIAAKRLVAAQRWHDTVAGLVALQAEYAAWYDVLPDNLRDTATGATLQAIVDLDLDDLVSIEPPRGFGRD